MVEMTLEELKEWINFKKHKGTIQNYVLCEITQYFRENEIDLKPLVEKMKANNWEKKVEDLYERF